MPVAEADVAAAVMLITIIVAVAGIVAQAVNTAAVTVQHLLNLPTLIAGHDAVVARMPKLVPNVAQSGPKAAFFATRQVSIARTGANAVFLALNAPIDTGCVHGA